MENNPIAVVTGANGFVGSHLVDLLLDKGYKVRCITRKSSNLKWLSGKDVEIFDCGLFDKDGLKRAFKDADYIYHVAGVVKSKTPDGYFMGNVETTRAILDTALEIKDKLKRVLIVSSQTACGPSIGGKHVNEQTEPHPITTYAKSKLEEEKLAKTYMDKLPITICRAPAVYGERDTEVFIFFQTFNRGLLTMVGLKDQQVSLIHADDLVRGFYLAATNPNSACNTYFIGSEKYYTWNEIGQITSKVLNKRPIKVKVPHPIVYTIAAIAQFFSMFSSKPATLNLEKARDLVQEYWTCDTSKAVRELGYHQEISAEEGIRKTCEWYKKMKWL
ncbi:MAG: NAD-dependent epimerase/dehydratase family protein [Clostridiales bacterium]